MLSTSLHRLLCAALLAGILPACQGDSSASSGAGEVATSTDASAAGRPAAADAAGSAAADAAASAAAGLGEGFIVWESNRSGAWRLWTRRLDGSGLKQLTPDERNRQHYCPHISPDGSRLAYLSARDGGRKYASGGVVGALHLLDLRSGEDRIVAEEAMTYFENRAVVWRSSDELIYIGTDRAPRRLDLASGQAELLARDVPGEFGWLVDATLSYASTNSATFSIYDRRAKRIRPRAKLGGCQPYFTHDGRWGVWTAGAGGPIEAMDLATRRIERLLDKNDPRLPDGLRYLYFPMPSRDSLLMAFAASRDEHDHFRSDYEVFVIETDPETLRPVGGPVRLTEHPATDRYPDVFLEPLALGRHRGEAPFEIELAVPEEGKSRGTWRWSFGDGGQAEGASVRHRFERPGSYRVVAQSGERELAAQVRVAPAEPPRALGVRIAGDGSTVDVEFDEPIEAPSGATVRFESGRSLVGWRVGEAGRTLEIELAAPFEGVDRLQLAGVTDRARPANPMQPEVLDVGPPLWPVERDGLVFVWESGDAPNLVPTGDGAEQAVSLEADGRARLDHHWRMILDGGRFLSDDQTAGRVARALKRSNELSLELTLTPGAGSQDGSGGAVDLVDAANPRHRNLRLRLDGGRLLLTLRTAGRGPEAYPTIELFALPAGRPSHVVVTYSPSQLAAYLDGEKRLELGAERIRGDFFHFRPLPLVFGSIEATAGRADVRLEGVAIYERVLSAESVADEFARSRSRVEEREALPKTVVRGRLMRRNRPPTLTEISPYREALVLFEYEVVEVVSGDLGAKRLRVAHWSILDGEVLPINRREVGAVHRLELEPFDRNPQIESLFVAQSESPPTGTPLFYAPDPGPMPGNGASAASAGGS